MTLEISHRDKYKYMCIHCIPHSQAAIVSALQSLGFITKPWREPIQDGESYNQFFKVTRNGVGVFMHFLHNADLDSISLMVNPDFRAINPFKKDARRKLSLSALNGVIEKLG